MRFKSLGLLVAAALCAGNAGAVGTLIKVTGAKDMVYDAQRDIMYISAGSTIRRYSVGSATMLSAITVGGSLSGIDLSPDGSTIAVADAAVGSKNIFLVDTNSLAVTKLVDPDRGSVFWRCVPCRTDDLAGQRFLGATPLCIDRQVDADHFRIRRLA